MLLRAARNQARLQAFLVHFAVLWPFGSVDRTYARLREACCASAPAF
jgi:hypothetical protein